MQSEPLILFPPTHEQSTPCFHVEGSLADSFLKYLRSEGLRAWEPPEKLEKRGPDSRRVVEIKIEADTPEDYLEGLLRKFLIGHPA
ncbi:MAG TPA: hypothetical protein VIS74_06940 [Chthoniobacterales bacterium]